LRRLFRRHFPNFPLTEGQGFPANAAPNARWSRKVSTPGFQVPVNMLHGNAQNFIALERFNDSIGKAG
jgi:hypothetical protein